MNRFGAMTTTSSRPSSIWASGSSGMPPCRKPTLPTTTVRARNFLTSPSSTEIWTFMRREPGRLDAADEVREPADLALELVVDAGHDRGVHAETGHHQEGRVGARVGHQRRQVDRAVLAAEHDVEGVAGVERDAEVAGQQVAGAVRQDADRDAGAGDLLAHRADRAVAAGGDDQVDLLVQRGGRLAVAGILDRRLVPERLGPAVTARATVRTRALNSSTSPILDGLMTTAARLRPEPVMTAASCGRRVELPTISTHSPIVTAIPKPSPASTSLR